VSSVLLTKPLVGARSPRVEVRPAGIVSSLGGPAIQLARMAGLEADDPWQRDAVDLMLGVRDDGKWSCFEYAEIVSRQNGKGSIGEIRVLAGLLILGERLIMWSAHEYKTAMEAFRRCHALIRELGTRVRDNLYDIDGIPVKVNNTNGEESFERLDTGARIKFIARSKGSGRGFSGDVNVIDEAFAYTPDQHAALLYTMSARPNPQIIYLSSPPLNGESGDILFDLRDRAIGGGDASLGFRDWGLAGDLDHLDDVDLDDRNNWAAANPALGIRITEETVARERRSTLNQPAEFARERLGIWPVRSSIAGRLLSAQRWAEMADPEAKRAEGAELALAFDVTPLRDHACIGLYTVTGDSRELMQLIDYRPGTEWLVSRLVELREVLNPVGIAYDAKNGAHAFLPDLAVHGIVRPQDRDDWDQEPRRGDLLELDTSAAVDAVGQFIDGFRAQPLEVGGEEVLRYVHLDQEPLNAAVKGAVGRPVGDSGQIAWGRKASEVDIGPITAITEARYCYLAWKDIVREDYNVLDSVF
jgi:hypothetical protein